MNKFLGRRIREVRHIMSGNNEEVLRKRFYELSLLFNKADKGHLDKSIINEMNLLKHEVSMRFIEFLKEETKNRVMRSGNYG